MHSTLYVQLSKKKKTTLDFSYKCKLTFFVMCHKVFSDISYTVASCTENEASRYGKLCFASVIVFPVGHARS